jgi:hypothetical protein
MAAGPWRASAGRTARACSAPSCNVHVAATASTLHAGATPRQAGRRAYATRPPPYPYGFVPYSRCR